jgi:hypothetical protein
MLALIFSLFVIVIVSLSVYKLISGKKPPDNSYTPFDHITGQTDTAFHEDKQDTEQEKKD